METWLHVGMPKCGSTTLQRHFAAHEAAHLDHGVLYPETGRSPVGYRAHRPLLHAARSLPALADGIAEEARAKGAERIVVSCEGFGALQPGDARGPAVATALQRATGGPVRVVAWVRHTADLAPSAFAQFAKEGLFGIDRARFWHGGPGSLARYLAAFREARGRDLLSALGHAQALRAAFDAHDVMLRSAEADDLGRGLLADMCTLFGVPRLPGPGRRNRRASERATAHVVEAQERFGPRAYDAARPTLEPWLRELPAEGFAPARLRLAAAETARANNLLAGERRDLTRVFATPVDALAAPRAPDPGRDEWLREAEIAELIRRMG